MSSEHRFGYEWDKYSRMTADYERQFRNWTHPLTPADWKGKRVLDAGCGMGRNSYWAMKYGASAITAFDYDERSVLRARETLKEFSSARVLFKSIDDIDCKDEFDIAFSIGVIHHLKDPKRALANMVTALRTGGTLLIWVYGYEGNEWIVRFVDPVRKHVTSKLPVSLVHVLAYFCSIPLYLFVKLFRGPSDYLKQLATFDFWHIHSIVFDQLIPDVAHYWSKGEVRALIDGLSLTDVRILPPPNNSGWILTGRKIAVA
ncbi:MAG: class I SAM-dependent methyltransferase [Patescibacteria group bacterium]